MKEDVMYFMIEGRLKVAEEILKDYQEQLAGNKETLFDKDYLKSRISELIIEIRVYRDLLACFINL